MPLDYAKHKNLLLQILKDIFTDTSISPYLGFKGGTAALMFYNLDRSSVDIDFDLLDESREQEVFKKVQETLSAALGVEETEISPDASLVRDLGAESIDFIDIIFRLEKAFDIKIPSGELFPANLLNDERFVQQGKVTPVGLEELRIRVPYMDVDSFSKDPQLSKMGDFFTVQMVANYLKDRLAKASKII